MSCTASRNASALVEYLFWRGRGGGAGRGWVLGVRCQRWWSTCLGGCRSYTRELRWLCFASFVGAGLPEGQLRRRNPLCCTSIQCDCTIACCVLPPQPSSPASPEGCAEEQSLEGRIQHLCIEQGPHL